MTDSDVRVETWKPIPGAGYYMASDLGNVRSITHTTKGRLFEGRELKPRRDSDGYLVVNITYDGGVRVHGVSVARLVLLAHAGEPKPGEGQACHGPGGQRDNRYPENLRWDTDEANREEWWRDNAPPPKPAKVCLRCGGPVPGSGLRCHPCVEAIGVESARLLAAGTRLKAVAEKVGYPVTVDGLDGVHRLARLYGGYGESRSRKVRKRLAARLAGGDAR
jgi:hypothetical protein